MRLLWTLTFLFAATACTTSAHLVKTANDTETGVSDVAADLAGADVVVFGEVHRTPAVHAVHYALLQELHDRRGDMVIAMEMFERDVQSVLLQYLGGVIDEPTFLARSRPWQPTYERDYRPVIEFAKENGIVVLAANAPRELAAKAAKEGVESVKGSPFVARETTAPEDEYWDAFAESMKAHAGTGGPGAMKLYYASQCLKDDTMAESIVDYLKQRRDAGARPLVVLVCGHFHSDYGRGTVARIKGRMPGLDIRVLSAELVADLSAGSYAMPRTVGDYVVVAQAVVPNEPPEPAGPPEQAGKPADPREPPVAGAPAEPAPNAEGLRPALGLMPDYAHQGTDGVRVDTVRDGGSADKAGIEAGDFIVIVNGIKVTDVASYAEALEQQLIGKTITVRVRRDAAEVDLQVLVGSRPR